MEYIHIINKLAARGYACKTYGSLSFSRDILNLRILCDGQTQFDASTLYLCSSAHLPDASLSVPCAFFYCGPRADFSVYLNSDFGFADFGMSVPAAELFNHTMEILSEIQQITAGMHLLVNALLSGKGLQALVDTATNLFGNPIYVVDLQHKYLAISAGIVPKDDVFSEEAAAGYISQTGIRFIHKNRINEKVREQSLAYYCVNTLVNKGMLIDAIHIQGIEVGHIMMMESEHPFRDFDAEFFHRFSRLVSVELQKDSAYANNKGVMYSYFLADLIRHPGQNAKNIREHLKIMGYHLKDTQYILAIPPDGHTISDLKLSVISEHLKHIFAESIYVIYENTIVFLISRDMDKNLSDYELKRLEEFLQANHLKAGISNFYQHLEDTARFYEQAVDSVRLAFRLKDPAPICYYSDYYLYKMLENYEKEDSEIRFLIHPGLMKLYLYEQAHGTELISTLTAYLKQPGQPAKIADAVHVHKNTLLYRMKKIREITGCSFTQGEDFMNFNLSICIMRYLHML